MLLLVAGQLLLQEADRLAGRPLDHGGMLGGRVLTHAATLGQPVQLVNDWGIENV